MKYFKTLSVTILSLFLLQACNDSDDKAKVEEVAPETTIVDVAVKNGNFTTLVAALQATGLDATLADKERKFTVFAPTDAAFALLGQDSIDALLADTDKLTNILTYHVISGEVNAATAISLSGTTVSMANNDKVGLSLDGNNLLVNTATVTTTDIQADNGIIHVIDAVLMPPTEKQQSSENIVETAIANGNFTTLVAALQATDLDLVLADESKSFTVFAPTDAAFALIGEQTINALLSDTTILSKILLQHVITNEVNSVEAYALNGTQVDTVSLTKVALSINSATDMLVFGGSNIVIKDIYTTNGIIHVIDAVIVGDVNLPAPAMSLVDIASADGNFTTLVSALQATGLNTTLANLDSNFTVFAPTDAAFAKLPSGTLDSLTAEQLTNILLYHVLPGKVLADGAITVAQSSENMVKTANGSNVSFSFANSMLFVNGAKVSTADVMADNGVIHAIDNVIMPPGDMTTPTQNIVEVTAADDRFSTLVSALTSADLITTLSNENTKFTVFAPTDDAFAKIDTDTLNALLADNEALSNVLLSHVISGASISALDAYAANGKSLTTASGATLAISVDAETGLLRVGGSNVTMTDIYTTNGVIHVIDTVILD